MFFKKIKTWWKKFKKYISSDTLGDADFYDPSPTED